MSRSIVKIGIMVICSALSLLLLQAVCFATPEVYVKSAGLDFIQNLLSDVDSITLLKELDNYDHVKDISSNGRLNSIYNSNRISAGVNKDVLEDKCKELINLKGALFASQLSVIILDSVKVAFTKKFDPLGQAVKLGVKKAETEIPRSTFSITYSFNYNNSIGDLVDFLYSAQAEAGIQEKYSILVEFLADLVNIAKIRRHIEIGNDSIILNKLAFGSTSQFVRQEVKKNANKENKAPPLSQSVPVQSVDRIKQSLEATTAIKTASETKSSANAVDLINKANNLVLLQPATPVPSPATNNKVAVETAKPINAEPDVSSKEIEEVLPSPKAVIPPSVTMPANPVFQETEKATPAETVNYQAPAKEFQEPPITDGSKSGSSGEATGPIRIKPKSEYAGIDECVQSNLGTVVSLSAGYGTMDVLKITRYLCEGILKAKPVFRYSGYEVCVEKNLGSEGDSFSKFKHALGYCDGIFDISDR